MQQAGIVAEPAQIHKQQISYLATYNMCTSFAVEKLKIKCRKKL